jgi:hypothetical protein
MRRIGILGALILVAVLMTGGVSAQRASAAFICLEVDPGTLEYGPYEDANCSIPKAKEKYIKVENRGVKVGVDLYCAKTQTAGLGFHELTNCSDATTFGGNYVRVVAVPVKCPLMGEEIEP